MRLRSSRRLHSEPDPQSNSSSSTPTSSPSLPQCIRPILTRSQVSQNRLRATLRPSQPLDKRASLRAHLLYTTDFLISIQAQHLPSALFTLWNRLPLPLQSRTTLQSLVHEIQPHHNPPLVRAWSQRCTLHLVTPSTWRPLSATIRRRIRLQCSRISPFLSRVEPHARALLTSGDLTPAVMDAATKHIPLRSRARTRYSVLTLACVDGVAYRIDGGGRPTLRSVPRSWRMQGESEEDGAAIIAGRFFSTYGPASEQDLRRWLGVEARVSRSAVGRAVAQGSIFTVRTEMGDMYVGSGNEAESLAVIARVWLLGRFDATVLAYQDKTWVVDEAWKRKIWTNNADVRPVVLVEGRAVGIWKWRAEKEGGVIRIELFYLINDALEEVVNRAKEVGLFYGGVRKIVIEMDGATIVEERVVVVGE